MFWAEIWKISIFYLKKIHCLVVKFSVYLNRHVFVMPLCIYSIFVFLVSSCLRNFNWNTVNPLFIDTQYNDKIRYNDNLTDTSLGSRDDDLSEVMLRYCIKCFKKTCFEYLTSERRFLQISKTDVRWGNKPINKPFLHIILLGLRTYNTLWKHAYQYEYMYMYEMYKTLFSSSLWYAVHEERP